MSDMTARWLVRRILAIFVLSMLAGASLTNAGTTAAYIFGDLSVMESTLLAFGAVALIGCVCAIGLYAVIGRRHDLEQVIGA